MNLYGEHHHRTRHSDETVERARQMHDDGKTRGEIAKELGISVDTIRDWIEYRTRTRLA